VLFGSFVLRVLLWPCVGGRVLIVGILLKREQRDRQDQLRVPNDGTD
jgi:hypothetical protein